MNNEGPAMSWMRRRPVVVVGVLVSVLVLTWIVAMPRSAGPDEPGHLIRSAALVRGQLDGIEFSDGVSNDGFELPSHIGAPDPVCFAFDRFQPASCVPPLPSADGDVVLGTRAADYPIWGHLPAGIGTFAPASLSTYTARVTDALIPVALLVGALVLAARRSALAAAGVIVAMTPMAWFVFGVVNPSGMVVGGAVALWAALSARAGPDRLIGWLTAAGWAAMVLPRRDGMVWAALIVALALVIDAERDPLGRWRRLGRWPQALIVVSTLATLAWAARSSTNASLALFAAPLAPIAAVAAVRAWASLATRPFVERAAAVAAVGLALGVVAFAVMSFRASGFDGTALRLTMERTGGNLTEAIGVLGWLDTPLPTTVTYLYLLTLGVLVGLALTVGPSSAPGGALGVLGTAIAASWVLTMVQNDASGTYWQGRYYLPLLVGIPIVLSRIEVPMHRLRHVGPMLAAVALIVANVALWVSMQRFGVGAAGSLLPIDWDTYGAPVPPALLVVVHAIASVLLVRWVALSNDDRPITSGE